MDDPEEAARLLAEQANADAFLVDLESRHAAAEKERDELRQKAESLESQLAETATQLASRTESLRSMESDLAAAQRSRQVFEDKCLTVQAEQKTRQERMDRMEAEADALREEISRLTESNSTMTAKLAEADTKKLLSSSEAIPLQYELERVRKELDSLSSHNKWLETELNAKSDQLVSCKTEHSKETIELRSNFDKAVADRDIATSHEEALMRTREELQAKVDQLSTQLFQRQQEATDAALAAEKELTAERRLVDLQKEQLERLEQRFNGVTKQSERMKELAAQAAAESRAEQDRIRDEVLKESQRALEQQAEEHRQRTQELEEELQEANRRRIEAEDGLMASPPSRRRRPPSLLPAAATDATGTSQQDDQEPLGLTDLYARLSEREDDLRYERTERRRLELYVQKIEAEMKAKAPVMLRQRQDYELAIEKYEESMARLNEALEEKTAYRSESSELQAEMTAMQKRSRELEQENHDLAKQVQALLRSRAGGEVASIPWDDSAGDDIPVCITIEEIQSQNQRLLREHRRLTDTVNELEQKLETDSLKVELENARKELSSMRQDRQRQETLVAGIVQQRDLYRALVSKHDSSVIGGGDDGGASGEDATALILSQQKEKSKEIEANNRRLEDDLAKVRADLSSSESSKEALEERLARYDAHSSELISSVDKLQSQVSSAKAAAARSEAEAAYHKEKCVRLDESLQLSRAEIVRTNEAKKEMQSVNAELQQSLAQANAEAARHEQQSRQMSMKLRFAETQLETAKAAETRITVEANSLRSELARQGALLDSIQRIEASLSAKNAEDKGKLAEDSERLLQTLTSERSKHAVEIENHLGKIRELEVEVKSIEKRKDEAMSELVEAKKEALAATSEKQALVSKSSRLEAEIRSVKSKLGEDVGDDEEVTMQTRIETLSAELESARAELAASKERVATYQTMAKASESGLVDLNKATEEYKRSHREETEQLQKKIELLEKETAAKQEVIGELTSDLASHRGEQEKIVSELNVQIQKLKEEVETSKKDAESSANRLAALNADITSYRADATTAQNNYERELALHASARTALRSARAEADSEIRLREVAEEKLEVLKAELIEERRAWEEEKTTLNRSMKETEKSLEETRAQNSVLHSQLETLGDMVEKTRSEKISALSTSTADSADDGANAAAATASGQSSDEVESLRKMVSEFREVVGFMRSEREVVQAQLDAARRTAERERAAFSVTKRSLDEARAELQLLQTDKGESGGNENVVESHELKSGDVADKLKQAEEQLTLLRESNKLLREEAEETSKSLAAAVSKLEVVMESVEPGEQKYRQLEVEKAAVEAEKKSLLRELDAWKGRVKSLVSKFHQVDPDEHEKVLKQVEELRKDCEKAKSQKETSEKESANAKGLLSRLNKELSQQRALVETQKKTISKISSEKDDATKSSKAAALASKERDKLMEEIEKMKSQAASRDTELKGANQRNEQLKTRLRQFQKMIIELKAKERELGKMKAKEVEREKAAQAKTGEVEQPAMQKQGEQPTSQDSSAAPAAAKAMEPPSAKTAQRDDSTTLPRVPQGGFRFGPGGTPASPTVVPDRSSTEVRSAAPEKVKAEAELPVPVSADAASSGETRPSESSAMGTVAPTETTHDKTASASVVKKPVVTEAAKAPVDITTKSGPQKRKAASEGKDEELFRERLMQKKRKLAEKLKKAKEETPADGEEKTVRAEDNAAKPDEKPEKLSAVAKTWLPPSRTSDSAPMEESEHVEASTTEATSAPVETTLEAKAKSPKEKGPQTETAAPSVEVEAPAHEEESSEQDEAAPSAEQEHPPEATLETPHTESANDAEDEAHAVSTTDAESGPIAVSKPASIFGSSSPFGSSGSAAAPGSAPLVFGRSPGLQTKSAQAATAFGIKPDEGSAPAFGSSFLNIKPPGSSTAPFTFGSSSAIKLPTPSKGAPAATPFGIFGQQMQTSSSHPFGGAAPTQAQPLFEDATSAKREAPSGVDDKEVKKPRIEEEEGDQSGQVEDGTNEEEEGEEEYAESSDGEA